MKRAVRRLLDLREEIQDIEEELEAMMKDNRTTLRTASGCGTVIAALIELFTEWLCRKYHVLGMMPPVSISKEKYQKAKLKRKL
ncbi:MAG: hypothetical protein A3I91_00885 [Candidatus Kerfeldbacteria bacterium RIFCSPLOWO2_02_FULL_42_19]|nr:MAG: hypothetical protein A3I91_00885 [Candidatus Kerfeldbacteria bacterium RIFCSPLOWO2_02_FULL_42_19]